MSRARRRYTDKFRASAVVMLEAAGYPGTKGALQRVADHLHMPVTTLHGWYNAERNPPPSNLRTEKKIDLVGAIRDEIWAVLGAMPNARLDASYRDMTVAIGILIDKLQLLTGEPTEIIEDRYKSIVDEVRALSDDDASAVLAEAERIIQETAGGGPVDSSHQADTPGPDLDAFAGAADDGF